MSSDICIVSKLGIEYTVLLSMIRDSIKYRNRVCLKIQSGNSLNKDFKKVHLFTFIRRDVHNLPSILHLFIIKLVT